MITRTTRQTVVETTSMCFIVLASTLFSPHTFGAPADKPNVVFLLSDDQGWGDYGFMGHPHLKTPNLDQLAREGLLYERGYTTAAICRPSLASIVTGLYPHQTAVRGNRPFMGEGVDHKRLRKDKKLWPLAQKQSKIMTATLANAPSMVRQLRDNGYATLQTGKWWEGDPLDHGFDEGCGHQIGRKTMQPIYKFVDKAQKNNQPFLYLVCRFPAAHSAQCAGSALPKVQRPCSRRIDRALLG